jgi:hypothetical protein
VAIFRRNVINVDACKGEEGTKVCPLFVLAESMRRIVWVKYYALEWTRVFFKML